MDCHIALLSLKLSPPKSYPDDADAFQVKQAQKDADRLAKKSTAPEKGSPGHLLGLPRSELEALAVKYDQPAYRGKQLYDAIYKHGKATVEDIAQVPKAWRSDLEGSGVALGRSEVHHVVTAKDGTVKMLLKLADNRIVETVGIPAKSTSKSKARLTVCVSSQVGCPMRCRFCATVRFQTTLLPLQPKHAVTHHYPYTTNLHQSHPIFTVPTPYTPLAPSPSKKRPRRMLRRAGEGGLRSQPGATRDRGSGADHPGALWAAGVTRGVHGYGRAHAQHPLRHGRTPRPQRGPRHRRPLHHHLLGAGCLIPRIFTPRDRPDLARAHPLRRLCDALCNALSQVGVPNALQKLARHELQSTLAISLHAPNQELREQIIP
eukprot:1176024-Prorocentrum_minimum.AAC.1